MGLNIERLIYESKKVETLITLRRGLENSAYDTLLKIEPGLNGAGRDFSFNDYFVLAKDLKQALILAVNKKIEEETAHIENLIENSTKDNIKEV